MGGRTWRRNLLSFELVLFVLILVLKQVDLPDFTLHGGTAPIFARSRLSSLPVLSVSITAIHAYPGNRFNGST